MSTPAQTASGAASFQGLSDKLAAIIYLLNTNNMTAAQIATGASPFQGLSDKLGCIIYLLASGAGGGGSASWLHGSGTPVATGQTATAGALYINDLDSTLWGVANGSWIMLV